MLPTAADANMDRLHDIIIKSKRRFDPDYIKYDFTCNGYKYDLCRPQCIRCTELLFAEIIRHVQKIPYKCMNALKCCS